MFSARFPSEPEGLSPQWEAREALRAAGIPVLDMTLSNPTAAGFAYPASLPGLLAARESLVYRPTPRGDEAARAAIAGYYRAQGRPVDPEDLILTASTSEAYAYLFKLLCDPGDEVLIPAPTYPLFDALAELEHVKLVRYPLRETQGRWRADFAFLESILSTRCKALILVHPNNPTGHLAASEEIAAYLRLAADHGLALIVDEVFSDYLLAERPYRPVLSQGPLVFTLNGLSKLLGLPQLKLGWIHVAGAAAPVKAAKARLEWIADAFLSVNTPVQIACPALLALREEIQGPIKARLRANLATARALCEKSGARLLDPEAGWNAILEMDHPGSDEDFCLALLKERRVYAHPGHLFGFEAGCRAVVSLIVPEADFRQGLSLMLAEAAA